jgi:hypothetical protein
VRKSSWRSRTRVHARTQRFVVILPSEGARAYICYNSLAMSSNATIDTLLVPEKTVVNAKGDGSALDISGAASRVFLLTLEISNII